MHRFNTRELIIIGLAIGLIATVVTWSVVMRVVPRTVVPIAVAAVHQARQLH